MLKNGQEINHYRILSAVGAGGMGEIFLAEDLRLKRRVALKILKKDFARDAARMQRFVREARAASALNHPNIITIHEIGERDEQPFIVTEFIEGETIRARLNRRSFSFDEILEVAVQIASALQVAHEAFIIHRDIKPENIMIRRDGIVKILDFGIAKLSEPTTGLSAPDAATTVQGLTLQGMIIGTPAYMSPEQARGQKIDLRSDIFSFGALLYEMTTGKAPFAGNSPVEIIAAILHQSPIPVNELIPAISTDFERIIERALQKAPDRRYQSVEELLIDLKKLKFAPFSPSRSAINHPPNHRAADQMSTLQVEIDDDWSESTPNNLTVDPLPIVGRGQEIAEIKSLLLDGATRLVTLTGIGGTGKTALAKKVAGELLTSFPDGIFVAELATVNDVETVRAAIAQSLGIKESRGKSVSEKLTIFLSNRRMLLVLDNFEQVIEAAPLIAELLSSANQLKILVTSRILLNLSIEREFSVPPLALPFEIGSVSCDELAEFEAVKLFIERAHQANPNFSLTEDNAASVVEICRRLDGLPLAIELAAARVKFFSPQIIKGKLEYKLKLLTGGARDLPVRQQTMRGAIEWSYDLLTEIEKEMFSRLAVFSGGFTFEAAEAVCASDEALADCPDVFELLASLIDKSLIVSKDSGDGETRFRMLEIVREFALECLEKHHQVENMCRLHAAYFLALGEESEPHLTGSESVKWLDRLENDNDNLRESLRWSLDNDVETAARLAAAIRSFWTFHTHLTEGRRFLEMALERGGLAVPPNVRFKLLNGLAVLLRFQGDYAAAQKLYEEGLAAGRAENDLRQISVASRGLGVLAHLQEQFSEARSFYEQGLSISRALGDDSGIAHSLNMLGDLARHEGDNQAARPLLEESLSIYRKIGNRQGVNNELNNLGTIALATNDFAAAERYFVEALISARELKDKRHISHSLDGFAYLAAQNGELTRAVKLSGAAEILRRSVGYEIEPSDRRLRDEYIARLKAALGESDFTTLFLLGQNLNLEDAVALCFSEESTGK